MGARSNSRSPSALVGIGNDDAVIERDTRRLQHASQEHVVPNDVQCLEDLDVGKVSARAFECGVAGAHIENYLVGEVQQ